MTFVEQLRRAGAFSPMQWEYLVHKIEHPALPDTDAFRKLLQELGLMRWELVTVDSVGFAYFKRQYVKPGGGYGRDPD